MFRLISLIHLSIFVSIISFSRKKGIPQYTMPRGIACKNDTQTAALAENPHSHADKYTRDQLELADNSS